MQVSFVLLGTFVKLIPIFIVEKYHLTCVPYTCVVTMHFGYLTLVAFRAIQSAIKTRTSTMIALCLTFECSVAEWSAL